MVDNTYFNTSPIWSPDGQQILFASARIGDLDRLRIIKKSARKQLYSYDLNKSKLVEFFNPKFSTHPDIVNFVGLTWNSTLEEIYFSNKDNTLYSISTEDKAINVSKKLGSECQITNLSLSNNSDYLIIEY